jgi:hypothetical protein
MLEKLEESPLVRPMLIGRCSAYAAVVVMPVKVKKSKAVPLHAMEALGGRGGIAPTHSRPRH